MILKNGDKVYNFQKNTFFKKHLSQNLVLRYDRGFIHSKYRLFTHNENKNSDYYTQKKVWLKTPEFRLFLPEKNVTESRTNNSG